MNQEYSPPLYQQNRIIEAFRAVPRFGHSDDVSNLFSTQSSDHADYIRGTIFISCILITIFSLWMMCLFIFTCLGKDRVGFLSGYALLKKPSHGLEGKNGKNKHHTGDGKKKLGSSKTRCCTTAIFVRWGFVISCLIVSTTSIVSTFVFGLKDLKYTIDSMKESAYEIRNIAHEGRTMMNTLKTYGGYSQTLREIILPDIKYPNFCVNAELDELSGGFPLNDTRQEVVDDLEALGNFYVEQFESMKDDLLQEVKERSENTWRFFNTYGIQDWQLYTFVISFSLIGYFMLVTTLFTCSGRPISFLICTSTWVSLPIFIVLVSLLWLVVSAFGMVAVMNADFCTGGSMLEGPDLTTMYIMERSKLVEESELLYDASSYWFNGCQTESPFAYINNYQNLLNNSVTSMKNLQNMMENVTVAKLEQICGVFGDFDSIGLYFDRLSENFDELISTSAQVTDILRCETMNSIYTDAVHDNACTEFPYALLWTFISLLIVSLFGIIMITLRPAWLEIRERKSKLTHELPIISIEKIKDFDDEQFNDSPSPKFDLSGRRRFSEHGGEDSSPLTTESEGLSSSKQEVYDSPSKVHHDPVLIYQSISVADDGLQEIPSSPKDPPGYRVY